MARLELHVTPGAGADAITRTADGAVRVRVTRHAANGEANRAALRLLARALGVAPSRLAIEAGARGRHKRVSVEGIDPDELTRRLRGIDEV